jgi:tRNA pseudouridine38-40 synthase
VCIRVNFSKNYLNKVNFRKSTQFESLEMFRYRFDLEYQGTPFCGWQFQPHCLTVQGVFEKALSRTTGEEVTCFAAGRTDSGVHASGQVVHATFKKDYGSKRLLYGTNAHMGAHPVVVREVHPVSLDFHARFSARQRIYEYILLNRPSPPVLDLNRVWWVGRPLCFDAMQEAAVLLEGTHNFDVLRSRACQAMRVKRTLDFMHLEHKDEHIHFYTGARAFLHNQVRLMVGLLVEVGLGRKTLGNVQTLLSGVRLEPMLAAPAQGLYFRRVIYPPHILSEGE